jgi:3-phosphoshikimate 1-carboxyvinyltransferase
MLRALSALGTAWELQGTTLTVHGQGLQGLRPPAAPIDCGNSATTLRLLAGALAAAGIPAVLDGSAGLRRRPMRRIVEPLRAMGAAVEAAAGGTAPLKFSARPADRRLDPTVHTLPVASAQVKSCLLLAALSARGPTTVREPAPSRDHTERMLCSQGLPVVTRPWAAESGQGAPARPAQAHGVSVTLTPLQPCSLPPLRTALPGDISAAAFLIVAALITPGSDIRLTQVGLNPTRTGLLDVLRAMGAEIEIMAVAETQGEPAGVLAARASRLHGVTVDGPLVVRMIDEFPIFAVAAAAAEGRTVVRGASELRLKESDRIAALCRELRVLGVDITETADGFEILGGRPFTGGTVTAHGDHRLAMALAIAGLAADAPVIVQDAEIIAESFPGFTDALQSLGAEVEKEFVPGRPAARKRHEER